jgi:hypothetical protein
VAPGSYFIMATTKSGGMSYYPSAATVAEAVPVQVDEGATVENINITRALSLQAIIGHVTDEQGLTPRAVEVEYGNEGGSHRGLNTLKDGRPDFIIDDRQLLSGRVKLFARAESEHGPVVAVRTIEPGSGPRYVEILLRPPGKVEGRFVINNGVTALPPINGVKFIPDGFMPFSERDREVSVDASGVFDAEGLVGRYRIDVQLPAGWVIKRMERDGRTLEDPALEIAEGDRIDL